MRRADLGIVALGLAVASWLLVRAFYGQLPPLHWWLPIPLGVLAVGEALGARTLRARLDAMRAARAPRASRGGQPERPVVQARRVEPLLVARLAVLAQASAYVGAVFGGVWAGFLAYVGPAVGRLEAAGNDVLATVLGVVCSAALVGAGLWLESVCRIPPSDEDPGNGARA